MKYHTHTSNCFDLIAHQTHVILWKDSWMQLFRKEYTNECARDRAYCVYNESKSNWDNEHIALSWFILCFFFGHRSNEPLNCKSEKLCLFLCIQCVYTPFVEFHFKMFCAFHQWSLRFHSLNEVQGQYFIFFYDWTINIEMLFMCWWFSNIPFAKVSSVFFLSQNFSFVFIFSDYFQNSSYIVYGMQCSLKVDMTQPTWSLPESHKSSWILKYIHTT